MRLNPPKMVTFWISIALALIGLIGVFISLLTPYTFWILFLGFVVLVLGLLVKGM